MATMYNLPSELNRFIDEIIHTKSEAAYSLRDLKPHRKEFYVRPAYKPRKSQCLSQCLKQVIYNGQEYTLPGGTTGQQALDAFKVMFPELEDGLFADSEYTIHIWVRPKQIS